MFRKILKKRNVTAAQLNKLATVMLFELDWWVDRGWLTTKSFKELRLVPVPRDFNVGKRLLDNEAVLRPKRIAA
jgi:hypothetical protein